MQATGVIRRIDDLGRIVIPKDIRMKVGIEEGDPFEIFIDTANRSVTFKKYCPTPAETPQIRAMLNVLSETISCSVALYSSTGDLIARTDESFPECMPVSDYVRNGYYAISIFSEQANLVARLVFPFKVKERVDEHKAEVELVKKTLLQIL